MGNKGLLKRMLPFFATFAVGIFIASFFVNIGASRNGYHDHGRCPHEMQQLRDENLRLQDELDSFREERMSLKHFDTEGRESPSVDEPVLSPPPPRPLRAHRDTAK